MGRRIRTMLSNIDMDKTISKEEYKQKIDLLSNKLGELQRKAKDAKIPAMLVFEGWDAAGKGTLINKVMQALDPRGFSVYPTKIPTENEKFHPFLWRFWKRTPTNGRIVFFDRSWYRRVTMDMLDKNVADESISNSFEDIINFERQMYDSGCIILKFFLHISKKEQMKRFNKLQNDDATSWRVTKDDLESHKKYDEYLKLYENMILKTNMSSAPWIVVESQDKRYATIKIYETIINALEIRLKEKEASSLINNTNMDNQENQHITNAYKLNDINLKNKILDPLKYKNKLKECQEKLRELEHEIYKKRIAVVVLYEGWDAAGKGGNIRRLVENLDPRGYEVIPIAAPNDEEKEHHYLWRFWKAMPKDGHIAIFDRSWYGRVLVERVEGFCTVGEWNRAYDEINEMEAHLARHGVVIAKFWLHIDKEEQLKRFNERTITEEKKWKITDEDWRNRDKWDLYSEAINDMLTKTNTNHAPWTIVESNDKLYGRIKVYETLIDSMEKALKLK
jgi:AMP-polyphosphate phosphotransferase